ncbi:MAG TPA: hypothetical protein VE090_01835 [Methylomirabilota bacterium]|nr:hypothetical protein [Methylomirabilota bacterium]
MIKKKVQKLVDKSYIGTHLDQKTVAMIADHMNRQSLKQYISLLKQEEKKKQVIITSPKSLHDADRKKLQSNFPNKQIIYILDPEMISGIKIVDSEMEYEMSLKQTFDDIIDHLSNYD